jgi:hypothetical protein
LLQDRANALASLAAGGHLIDKSIDELLARTNKAKLSLRRPRGTFPLPTASSLEELSNEEGNDTRFMLLFGIPDDRFRSYEGCAAR